MIVLIPAARIRSAPQVAITPGPAPKSKKALPDAPKNAIVPARGRKIEVRAHIWALSARRAHNEGAKHNWNASRAVPLRFSAADKDPHLGPEIHADASFPSN